MLVMERAFRNMQRIKKVKRIGAYGTWKEHAGEGYTLHWGRGCLPEDVVKPVCKLVKKHK
jgi:hypothetical protein